MDSLRMRLTVILLGMLGLAACASPAMSPGISSPTQQPVEKSLQFIEFYSPM